MSAAAEAHRVAVKRWKAEHPEEARRHARLSGQRRRAANPELFQERDRIRRATSVRLKEQKRAATSRRRARMREVEIELFDDIDVFRRDEWTCGICLGPVDQALSGRDPRGASLDHIIPLSEGGPHTLANVRCTHLECNMRRGTG